MAMNGWKKYTAAISEKKLNKHQTIPNKALLFGATIRKTIMASEHQTSPQMLRT